jgi:hypothetical protein
MKELDIKGANAMQSLGGIETYQRRYLYMSALDITENDMFDASSGSGSGSNNSGKTGNPAPAPNKQPDQPPQVGIKKASEAQVKMINDIVNDITKGYAAIGQKALPEAIISRMKETLQINKEFTDFLIADASKAIDYLTDIRIKIPKPQPPVEDASA